MKKLLNPRNRIIAVPELSVAKACALAITASTAIIKRNIKLDFCIIIFQKEGLNFIKFHICKSKFIESDLMKRNVFILLVVFVLFGAIIAGCTSQTPTSEKKISVENNQPTKQPDKQSENVPSVPPKADNITKIDNAETKTSVEKTKEVIDKLIADGTYTDKLTYEYHSGNETVDVKITVEKDIVQEVSVSGASFSSPTSEKIIKSYGEALPKLVIGKKIDQLNLSKNVAGSSLTNAAFKQYVDKIIKEN